MLLNGTRLIRRLQTTVAAAALVAIAGAAGAQEITLKAINGSASITGELKAIEDGHYLIETRVGLLRIRVSDVLCEGDACSGTSPTQAVRVAGDTTVGESLFPLLLQGFASTDGGIAEEETSLTGELTLRLVAQEGFGDDMGTFSMRSTGSDGAFRALLERSAEIGLSARRILPAEARALRDAGAGNMIDFSQEHVIAVDNLSVMVHQDNPVKSLSMEDLDGIYSGRITNWNAVGGPDAEIRVYGRAPETSTAQSFEATIFAESGRSAKPGIEIVEADTAMASAIAADPTGIGYLSFAFQQGGRPVAISGSCGIAVTPDRFLAKTEEYPIQRRVYLYNRGDMQSPSARNLLDYATSDASDEFISRSGFIDLGIMRRPMNEAGGRIENVIRATEDLSELGPMREVLLDMIDYDRLSTTFRFASGSSRMDGKAMADLERLVAYLQQQPQGTEVAIVGFTDSDGAFGANRDLSLGRAQQVAAEIAEYGGNRLSNIAFTAKGYGELAPATCNDRLEGKRINRRVEVWIRNPS
jgi:phosphate transport system substrate-binding protein